MGELRHPPEVMAVPKARRPGRIGLAGWLFSQDMIDSIIEAVRLTVFRHPLEVRELFRTRQSQREPSSLNRRVSPARPGENRDEGGAFANGKAGGGGRGGD